MKRRIYMTEHPIKGTAHKEINRLYDGIRKAMSLIQSGRIAPALDSLKELVGEAVENKAGKGNT